MTKQALALISIVGVAAPALGQEIIFTDDFQSDQSLWLWGPGDPADHRTIDPLDPANQVARVVLTPWGGYPDLRSVPTCRRPFLA